jgi:hypothetical protein
MTRAAAPKLSPHAQEAIALAKRLGIKAHGMSVSAHSVTIFDKTASHVVEAANDRQNAADQALQAWTASQAL